MRDSGNPGNGASGIGSGIHRREGGTATMAGEGQTARRSRRVAAPTNGAMISEMQELRHDLNDFRAEIQDWRNNDLLHQFMPRGEADLLFRESAEDRRELHAGLAEIQVWRLAQVQAEGVARTNMELKIQVAASAAVQEALKTQARTTETIGAERAAIDGRTISFYVGLVLLLVGQLLTILFTYFKPH